MIWRLREQNISAECGSRSKSFAIRSAINQGSSYTLADMAYINNNFVLTNGGQILNIIGLAGDESYFKNTYRNGFAECKNTESPHLRRTELVN